MDTEVDLTTADRAVLIERLERRIAELAGQAKPGGPPPECPATSPVRAGSHRRSSSPESSDATASPARA